MIRKCSKCKQLKSISRFSRSSGSKYHSQCKECISIYYRNWYAQNGRKRSSDYKDICLQWNYNNSDKIWARTKVQEAIKRGLLTRPLFCNVCGRKARINGHHQDYNKPFQILWVCSSCHKKIHSANGLTVMVI